MYFLYNLLLVILYPLFLTLSLLIPKLSHLRKIRENDLKRIKNLNIELGNRRVIWLHAASVGELDQARALAGVLKTKIKDIYILQSVYSTSVSEKQLEDQNFDFTFHLPFDFPFAYNLIIRKFHPRVLMILAWDSWPNLIRDVKKSGAKAYLACASLSESSGRSKGFAKYLTKSTFQYLDGIYPSHEILLPFFQDLITPPTVLKALGDTRFDTVLDRIETKKPTERFLTFVKKFNSQFLKDQPVLLGSTYPVCEEHFLSLLQRNTKLRSAFWIFPHKWDADRMNQFAKRLEGYGDVATFSDLLDQERTYPRFLLFDEMGILAFAYRYASFAYIGGGFHHRIHNTIEPAAFGLTLVTGPRIENAPEALVMQKLGGLFSCKNFEEFNEQVTSLLFDPIRTKEIGEKNRKFVLENRGASERIYLNVLSDALS